MRDGRTVGNLYDHLGKRRYFLKQCYMWSIIFQVIFVCLSFISGMGKVDNAANFVWFHGDCRFLE